jgi:uncharacterized protein (TIGR03437 family)
MSRRSYLWILLFSVPAFAQFAPNRYTVLLEDPPVAAQFARREDMRTATAQAYQTNIESKQAAVIRALQSRNIKVIGSVSTVLNAVFVTASPDRVADIQSIPGVAGVRPMRIVKPNLNQAVQLANAPAAWNALGGVSNAGKGIKIGIIDSGMDINHLALQDSSLTPPAGFPKCTTGHPEDCAYTNNKVIVARSYVRQLATSYGTDPSVTIPDDYTPRDRIGHGTGTATVAAGNTNTGAVTINGMAPKAFLGNYKIFGSPGVNDGASDNVLIQAVNDALNDGMDVVNLSASVVALTGPLDTGATCGLPAGQACDPIAMAYENAAKAGMVIVASAGNRGDDAFIASGGSIAASYPYYLSMDSPASAPSVIAVGATTNAHVMTPSVSVNSASAPSNVKKLVAVPQDSVFSPSSNGANTAPLVDAGDACNTLPSMAGAFALILRGNCTFATKFTNVQNAGVIGAVVYMADSTAPIFFGGLDCNTGLCFIGPAVMISNADGVALKSYIAQNPAAAVTIDSAGIETDVATYVAANGLSPAGSNQLASYSSLGPTPDGALKPDMVAVGGFDGSIATSAGFYTAGQQLDPNGEMYTTNGYVAVDGTSFSSPLVAGAAALVKQAHPGYTSAQIKSALVNAAAQDVTTDDTGLNVNTLWVGAGRLDAGAAVNSQILVQPATVSFGFVKSGSLPLTRQVTVLQGSGLTATVTPTAAGATVAASLSGSTLTVTLSGTVPAAGQYTGVITLAGSGASAHIPYMFIVPSGAAANANLLFASIQGTPGQSGGIAAFQVVDRFGAPVAGSPVSFSVSPRTALTFVSVSGEPACTPNNSSTTTCNTDNYGIAYVGTTLGSATGTSTITARATAVSGASFQVSAFTLPAPAVDSTQVFNAGYVDAGTPIAPGSFMGLKGTNLVDPDLVSSQNFDLATTALLPLTLDAVTVSFDVPSKGISVPASMYFVSPTQINVVVPWELQGQTSAQMKVIVDEAFGAPLFSNVVTVQLSDASPAWFADPATGIVAARDLQGVQIFTNHSAVQGQAIQLYANGLGPVSPQPASGNPSPTSEPLSRTTATPVVMIGGKQAQVLYCGLAPGNAAEYQINVNVPTGLTPGNQQITVAIGGKTSKAAVLPVQ